MGKISLQSLKLIFKASFWNTSLRDESTLERSSNRDQIFEEDYWKAIRAKAHVINIVNI